MVCWKASHPMTMSASVTDLSKCEDVNFCCHVSDMDSPWVKLTPFILTRHAKDFFEVSKSHPELYRYLPFGPFETLEDFAAWQESRIRSTLRNVLFAVIDKTQVQASGALAGIIGLLDMTPDHASVELGFLITLPSFQHTHVTANAIGLLLHYCLDLPDKGGLGLRRVQWKANAENLASIRVAEKLGFEREGLLRWHWVLSSTKEGKNSRVGDPISGPGRDTVVLAMCWDDWEVKRSRVDGAFMKQVIKPRP